MLCRYDDAGQRLRGPAVVRAYGHLRFSIGSQPGKLVLVADPAQAKGQRMGQRGRKRHERGGFRAGIAVEDALIARAKAAAARYTPMAMSGD